MARHPDVEGLEALEENPGVIRGKAGADVAQRNRAVAESEGDLAQLGEDFDYMGPDEFAKYWRQDYQVYKDMAKLFKK